MASVKNLSICTLCNNKQKRPKRLKCYHTFCESCLASYVVDFIGKPYMPCPQCGYQVTPIDGNLTITADIVGTFEDDKFISTIVNIFDSDKVQKAKCEMHVDQTVSRFCYTCHKTVCNICKQIGHGSCCLLEFRDKDKLLKLTDTEILNVKEQIETLSMDMEKLANLTSSKITSVEDDNSTTATSITEYYSHLKAAVTQYLTSQESKVISRFRKLVENEIMHHRNNLQTCLLMKSFLAERQTLVSNFDSSRSLSKNQVQSLLVSTKLSDHIRKLGNTLAPIKSDTEKELNMRFIINTELEDKLQEHDLVQIELLSSCHSPEFAAFNNVSDQATSEGGASNQEFQRKEQRSAENQRPNVANNGSPRRGRDHDPGRTEIPSILIEGNDSRRTHAKTRTKSLSQSLSPKRYSETDRPRPRSFDPRDRENSRRDEGLPDYNSLPQRYRVDNPPRENQRKGGPPPTYQGFLDRRSSVRHLRNSRFPVPSAPPLSNDRELPGVTAPISGFIPPQDTHIFRHQPLAQILNVNIQTFLPSMNWPLEKRDARIIGIACMGDFFVVADKWNNSLKLISHDSTRIIDVLSLNKHQPWDICTVNVKKCAVAAPTKSAIIYVGFHETLQRHIKILGTLNVPKKYACVSYMANNDRLVCGVCPPHGPAGIDILSSTGILLRTFGNDAHGNDVFKYPRNIEVTENGDVFVCDLDAKRVVSLNLNSGAFKECKLFQDGHVGDPQAVCVNVAIKYVLVADSKKNTLYVLSYSGDLLKIFTNVFKNKDPKRMAANGNQLVVAHGDGTVTCYTLELL